MICQSIIRTLSLFLIVNLCRLLMALKKGKIVVKISKKAIAAKNAREKKNNIYLLKTRYESH